MWLALSFLLGVASAGTEATCAAALEAARPALDRHAVHPLTFTEAELRKAARGQVARRRERLDGADRVVGLVWTPLDRRAVWLGAQDYDGFDAVEGFVEELLPGSTPTSKLAFQKIDFPWPFADRQWVIRVANNQPLLAATDGVVWERSWRPSPERGASAEDPKAVWVEVNDGGWYFVDCAGGTLVAYHVRTVIGGSVPDEAVTRWSMATLGGLLSGIVERAATMPSHYVAGHAPVLGFDAAAVPPYGGGSRSEESLAP